MEILTFKADVPFFPPDGMRASLWWKVSGFFYGRWDVLPMEVQ